MLYLRMCFDRTDTADLRAERLKQHREYIATFIEGRDGARVVQGGPMLDETETGYRGSFLVVEAGSLTDVRAFHEGDPFTQAGLFDMVHLIPWERHIGNDGAAPYVA